MELAKGLLLANEIIGSLRPYCSRIEVAGSIRRRKTFVHYHIDIVLITKDIWGLNSVLYNLGTKVSGGSKTCRITYKGAQVDIYFASEETWATLFLIRTGPTEQNIRLCKLARTKNMVLHADGSGLFRLDVMGCEGREVRIAGDTEDSIFKALGLPYRKPEERQ